MYINGSGLLMALFVFLMIGLFHPIVIKCEYHFSAKIWPVFLIVGILFMLLSLFTRGNVSIMLGILAASCFWSILELKQQAKRVEKGWFPKKPTKSE